MSFQQIPCHPTVPHPTIFPLICLSGFYYFMIFHQNRNVCIGNPDIQGIWKGTGGAWLGEIVTLEDILHILFIYLKGGHLKRN